MIFTEFSLPPDADGILTVGLQPPTPIGGWGIDFRVLERFDGASGLIVKNVASGYGGGQSGITITNSGQGIFNVRIKASDGSGLDPGTYAAVATRTDSGYVTPLMKGWLVRLP